MSQPTLTPRATETTNPDRLLEKIQMDHWPVFITTRHRVIYVASSFSHYEEWGQQWLELETSADFLNCQPPHNPHDFEVVRVMGRSVVIPLSEVLSITEDDG